MKNEELRKGEERYYKMVEEIQDYAIILLDKDGYILNWNKGAEKIKGYSAEEIIGKNFRIFYLQVDRDSKLPEKLIAEAVSTGRAQHEGLRQRKDGTTFWGSIVITAIHDDENNVIGFTKVTRDLTEKKFAEDELKRTNNELAFQNRELEQFVYAASHDLQEPLRKIQTFSDLAAKENDTPMEVRRYMEKINNSAGRMASLIKDLLIYSQVLKAIQEFSDVDLNEILKEVQEDFEVLISDKQAIISCDKLPTIKGIPSQMRQLFSNLLGNAIKFSLKNPVIEISSSPAPQREIESYEELDATRRYFKIQFKDNGIGFNQHYAALIFKLFQRLDSSKLGTGIGLAIAKKIVENHKGHIIATGVENQGATFIIYIPA